MSQIANIEAIEILDSRGNPTVEVQLTIQNGVSVFAASPSGASTGTREAKELRDQDAKRFLGKGVLHAVNNVNTEIRSALLGWDCLDQNAIDAKMCALDGTKNKERLGANAILAVSLAVAKAAAAVQRQSLYQIFKPSNYKLPVPQMNIINGGVHADNGLDIQEFMLIPAGAMSFSDALRYGTEVFHALKALLKAKGLSTAVGDEGGFAPNLSSHHAALEIIMQAIEKAGFKPGQDVFLGLDLASSEFYQNSYYQLQAEGKRFTTAEFVDYIKNLINDFPIISIEDAMAEQDSEGWRLLSNALNQRLQLVGDDLFVTNTSLLEQGITEQIANAILIKPNQIGTLTETLAAIQMAHKANYRTIISHRSGETEDTTIADLAVGVCATQIKTGSLCRGERIAKYNRLLWIERELGNKASFWGKAAFNNL